MRPSAYALAILVRKLARDPGAAENDDFLMYAGKNVSRPPNHASNFATIIYVATSTYMKVHSHKLIVVQHLEVDIFGHFGAFLLNQRISHSISTFFSPVLPGPLALPSSCAMWFTISL